MRILVLILFAFCLLFCPDLFADGSSGMSADNVEKVVISRGPQTWQEIVGTVLAALATIWAAIFGKSKFDKKKSK